jgi:hypothetical protein
MFGKARAETGSNVSIIQLLHFPAEDARRYLSGQVITFIQLHLHQNRDGPISKSGFQQDRIEDRKECHDQRIKPGSR